MKLTVDVKKTHYYQNSELHQCFDAISTVYLKQADE